MDRLLRGVAVPLVCVAILMAADKPTASESFGFPSGLTLDPQGNITPRRSTGASDFSSFIPRLVQRRRLPVPALRGMKVMEDQRRAQFSGIRSG